ncbi:hypothetical protein MKW92_044700 [Papaver armeniacum]|nr:hypothetical protein MKW92_044700 [Papaver armeniacum]
MKIIPVFTLIFIRLVLVTSQSVDDAHCPFELEEAINTDDYVGGDAEFELRVQWVYSRCNIDGSPKCISPIPKEFTVYGLWRKRSYNQGPPASKAAFNLSKFNDELRVDMLKYWPNIYTNARDLNNSNFWGNEWREHGRWSGFSHNYYFTEAIQLFKSQPITDYVLRTYTPGPAASFTNHGFERNMREANLRRVHLKCNTDINNRQQLVEIGINYRYINRQWFIVDHPQHSECDSCLVI